MPCPDSSTICARRQVTTDPLDRRTIRSSRLPSSLLISRTRTRSAIAAPGEDRNQRHETEINKPPAAGTHPACHQTRPTLTAAALAGLRLVAGVLVPQQPAVCGGGRDLP